MNNIVTGLILNWNGEEYLDACVESVLNQSFRHLELLIVDNGSTDHSIENVEKNFPQVRLIRNNANLGFGGGNNVGIRTITTPFILMLNNDVTLDPYCVEKLHETIIRDQKTGSCASKILLKKMNNCVDAAGIAVCPDGLSIGRGRGEPANSYSEPAEVFFASDCCCLYRKEMLDEIGLYDADFFAYAEETDLGWRAQLFGWRCMYVPEAIVYHHHSASAGSHSPFKAYLVERNRIWLALKNFPVWLLAYGMLYSLVRYFWQAFGALAGKGRAGDFTKSYSAWKLVTVLLSAYVDAAKGLPRVLRQRRALWPQRKNKGTLLLSLLKHYGVSAKSIALRG